MAVVIGEFDTMLRGLEATILQYVPRCEFYFGQGEEALRQKSRDPEVSSLVNSINESVDALEGLFSQLLDVVKMEVTRVMMTVRIQTQEEATQAAEAIEERAERISNVTYTHPNEDGSVSEEPDLATVAAEVPKVGRNDPCPCGSGKKYKKCCGAN